MTENQISVKTREKRTVLIVDDETINREILGMLLSSDYDVLYAENGREAMEKILEYSETLSLVLLDLLMPEVSGMEVLKEMKETPAISKIPVIVMTADYDSEVVSLDLGALDFISKPYPPQNVILARIRRIIELSEDRQIIRQTERDGLTGLYNLDYFYNYAEKFEQYHKNVDMDAIVVDINHFHIINERYGKAYAERVLRAVASKLREYAGSLGGIVCRKEGDTFMIYCPHTDDLSPMLDAASDELEGDEATQGRVHLRMGIYPSVDKTVGIEQRFDRAKAASDSVSGNYARNVGVYDKELYEKELFAEQLAEEFDRAVDECQFSVFFQPKFDVRGDEPSLSSAEALVRWNHPKLGFISPGVFIPVFENNGMIQKLDRYVWRKAAEQVKRWKSEFGVTVPVSVNVSRIDIFDPEIVSVFESILKENGLSAGELVLEITESAYSDDEEFLISTVNSLRDMGFRVEMDDFGTGYSSLGMLTRLPIDALKLDMIFIRNAFSDNGDMRMIELIIDIAKYLGVPVIAEGVETAEQVATLKEKGCDIIQGFYFSKSVPPSDFDAFVAKKTAV